MKTLSIRRRYASQKLSGKRAFERGDEVRIVYRGKEQGEGVITSLHKIKITMRMMVNRYGTRVPRVFALGPKYIVRNMHLKEGFKDPEVYFNRVAYEYDLKVKQWFYVYMFDYTTKEPEPKYLRFMRFIPFQKKGEIGE